MARTAISISPSREATTAHQAARTIRRPRIPLSQDPRPLKNPPSSPKKSSKNNQLYFTQSVRSRLEKCSSHGSLLCVENSSASRTGEVILLPHGLRRSPAIAARLCAFLRGVKISAPALPFSVSCFVFSVSPEHPVRKIAKSKNTAFPSDISENYSAASSGHRVRKIANSKNTAFSSDISENYSAASSGHPV